MFEDLKSISYGVFAFGSKKGMLDPSSVNAFTTAISGLNAEQAVLALTTRGLTETQQKQVLLNAGLIASSDHISGSLIQQALANEGLDKEKQDDILINLGLMDSQTKELIATRAVTEELLRQQLINQGYQGEKLESMVASAMQTKQNGLEAMSWEVLGTKIKKASLAMLKNPLTWVVVGIAAIAGLVKGYDALIGKHEKLAKQDLEKIGADLQEVEEEIASLETLQDKLIDAKGNKSELAKISEELNSVIGETKGLLNGESKAWDIANTKIEANIALLKEQKKQLQQDKVDKSRVVYDNNVFERDWNFDIDGETMRDYVAKYNENLSKWNSLSPALKESYGTAEHYAFLTMQNYKGGEAHGIDEAEWAKYWGEQVDYAYDVFADTIDSYEGVGGQGIVKQLISDMVWSGADLDEINDALFAFIDNSDIQDAINTYWESFTNPDINTEEALKNVRALFDSIIKEYPELKGFFNDYYNQIMAGGNSVADNTVKNVDKMTVSLDDLKNTSEGIDTLSKAFKELNDNGYITTDTLSKIKEATGLADDEWSTYEQRLLGAKAGSNDFNQVLDDLTYKILEAKLKTGELTEAEKKYVDNLLKSNGVVNATEVASSAIEKLVTWENIFNDNKFDNVDKKIDKLNEMAKVIGKPIAEMVVLNSLMSGSMGGKFNEDGSYTYKVRSSKPQDYADKEVTLTPSDIQAMIKDAYDAIWEETKPEAEYLPPGNSFDDSYYSTIDAQISESEKEIDRLEKEREALNRQFENTLDTGNKEQSEILRSKLAENAKAQKDILASQNEEYRTTQADLLQSLYQYAPSLSGKSWNEISEVDLANIENDLNNKAEMATDDNAKNQAKKNLNQFKGVIEDLKAVDNLLKENSESWWEADENAKGYWESQIDFQESYSRDWIDNQKAFDKLNDREELAAYSRMINNNKEFQRQILNDTSLSEEAKLALIRQTNDLIVDAEKDAYNLRKDMFSEATDFGNTYLESKKTLLQSYYDITNSIAEAQHEINKELETSKTMYEYLDEDTRELLFNQEDYNTLSEELYDIQYKADKLQRQYEYELANSTLNTIEEITSNYEMQYKTLMKSYEIAKADLDIAKKKAKLNNVLNERNVRMFINGQWQWVANTEDVANAKAELADAEYAKRVEEAGLTQQESIDNLTRQQNQLSVVVNNFKDNVIDLSDAVAQATTAIGHMPTALSNNLSSVVSSSSNLNSSNRSRYYSTGGRTLQVGADGNAPKDATIGDIIRTAGGDYKVVPKRTEGATYNPDSGLWSIKVKEKLADGTKHTTSGMTLIGEDGFEAFINQNGHLIPVDQPTVGNIGAGGIVFNEEQLTNLRSLWDLSNVKFNTDRSYMNRQLQQIDQSQDNRIIIGNMTVDNGTQNGKDLIDALRRYIGNH